MIGSLGVHFILFYKKISFIILKEIMRDFDRIFLNYNEFEGMNSIVKYFFEFDLFMNLKNIFKFYTGFLNILKR